MTQIPGSEGGAQPLRHDQLLAKAAQPQRQAENADTEPATRRLAMQSHTLELSKANMPASELAALKVHFGSQQNAKGSPETFAAPDNFGTAWPQATHPIYGSPSPRLPKSLFDNLGKDWNKGMDMRLIYGAPSPTLPQENLPEKSQKPVPDGAPPAEPRPWHEWRRPIKPEHSKDRIQDWTVWPEDMGMRLIYGAPSPLVQKLKF